MPAPGLPGLGQPLRPAVRPFVLTPPVSNLAPPVLQTQPDAAATPGHLYELGLTTAAMGFHTAAIEALRDCTTIAPGHAAAWRKLAAMLRLANEDGQAEAAEAAAARASKTGAGSEKAVSERPPAKPDKAERRLSDTLKGAKARDAMASLRDRLVADPRDVAAMRLLARLELATGDTATSWSLLQRALDICPSYIGAREDYAKSLLARRAHVASPRLRPRACWNMPRATHATANCTPTP